MSSQKIRSAARKWAEKWHLQPADMTPDQIQARIQYAYIDGVERGRRDQRNADRRRKGSRGNIGAEEL